MLNTIKTRIRYCWNMTLFPVDTHESIARSHVWSVGQERVATATLVLASLIILLPCLAYPLIEPDETRYAQIAFEMIESGNWITPMLDGEPYLDKPPLMYWITAASFTIFGETETAARLPPALSALATVLLTFWLGRRLVGNRAAWFGGIALLLCGGFVLAGRFLVLDSLLAFFVTASLLSGYIAVRERDHRWVWWIGSGVACALGVLTKGPVAFVLCVPPLIASGWLRDDHTRTRLPQWIAFFAPIVAFCVPWYIAVWASNSAFGEYFFWEHHFKRFTEGMNHRQPLLFYVPVIFAGMFPASLLLPSIGVFLFGRSDRKRELRSKDLGFLFCSSAWILLFFSAASCKLPTYILPVVPLVCLMLGEMLDHTVFNPQRFSGITRYLKPFPQRASLILLVFCFGVLATDVWLRGSLDGTLIVAVGVGIALVVFTLVYWNREVAFSAQGWGFVTLVAFVVMCVTNWRFIPTFAESRSLYEKTAALYSQEPRDATIIFFGEEPHAARLQLPAEKIIYFHEREADEFVAFVEEHDRVIVVADDEDIEATRQAVAATHELFATSDHERLYMAIRIGRPSSSLADSSERGRR